MRAERLAANTGSECAGAGVLFRPRANVCVCVYLCRFSGRPWEPIHCLPESGAVADGQCIPHMRDTLYRCWPVEEAVLGRLVHDWLQVAAEQQAEPRRMMRKIHKCVLIGRTRGGRCLR